jgi:hypothetical protein
MITNRKMIWRRCITLVPIIVALVHSKQTDHTLRRQRGIVALDNVASFKNEQFKRGDHYEWLNGVKGTKSEGGTSSTSKSTKLVRSASSKSSKSSGVKSGVADYSKDMKPSDKRGRTQLSSVESESYDTKSSKASTKSSKADTKSSKANTRNSKAETKSSKSSKSSKSETSGKKQMGPKKSKARSSKSEMVEYISDGFTDELDLDFDFSMTPAPTRVNPTTPAPTQVIPTTPAPTSATTMPPTPVPSAMPTASPAPSAMPTASPAPSAIPSPVPSAMSAIPTASPSMFEFELTQAPTPLPTEAPVFTPEQICSALPREVSMLNVLVNVTDETLLTDPSTPQGMAFAWLLNDDPLQVDPCTYVTILQRYALATFSYSTGSDSWNQAIGWLSGQFECDWLGITCIGGDLVTQLLLCKYNGWMELLVKRNY